MKKTLKIKLLDNDVAVPKYMTTGSAAMDVCACLKESVLLNPGDRALIPTGIIIEQPIDTVVLVCARSGLASKHGITLSNGVGVIDSDYTGEIKVALVNLSNEPFLVEDKMRVAQLMVLSPIRAELQTTDEIQKTERGDGGFGSTGEK